ncbi:MAG TPA: hypothetical protein VJR06_01140 [Nitrososphaerales archaeon]|nr:hypothetical protein [Nitrososphaerales archaeon]
MTEGKIQVVVRSRMAPSDTIVVKRPLVTPAGFWIGDDVSRKVIFHPALDAEQQMAVAEGRRLADAMGLKLEIVDEAKVNFIRRVLLSLGRGFSTSPKLVITPSSGTFGGAAMQVVPCTAC